MKKGIPLFVLLKRKFFVCFILLSFLCIHISAQNSASIILNPASTIATIGQSFTVNVIVDFISVDSINGAEIHLTFDKTKLSVISITKPSSGILNSEVIPLQPINTININGQINYAASTSANFPKTDFNLLSIIFKPIVGSGITTPLTFLTSFPNKSDVVRSGYSILNSHVNGAVKLCTTPAAMIAASTCNAANVSLSLASVTGTSPYSLIVNGTTYNGVTAGSTFASIPFPVYKIWPANPVPAHPSMNDGQGVQVGVKFRSSATGFIKGIRFYNGNSDSGTYTGKLWKYNPDTLLKSENFTGVTTNGWQELLFSSPVAIAANTTYIASYYSSAGNYARDLNFFTSSSGLTNGPLTVTPDSASGGNGVFRYGTEIPNRTWQSSNYWVDVIFSPNTNTFNLTSVTDANGCSNSDSLQTLNVTSTVCPAGRFMNTPGTSGDIEIITQNNPGTDMQEINHNVKVQGRLAGKRIYNLGQNYPNPFNNETTIQFTIPKAEKVNLSLFDISGRLVKVLVNGSRVAGTHTIYFNAGSLSTAVYYYRMQTGDFTDMKKLTIQ